MSEPELVRLHGRLWHRVGGTDENPTLVEFRRPESVQILRGWTAGILEPRTAQVTMTRMRALVHEQLGDPLVFEAAAQIVAGIPGTDYAAQATAIARWLRTHTSFLRDPAGRELLRTPMAMLAAIERDGVAIGDCDDVAMLGAALAQAIGFRARFVAEAYRGPHAPFEHVFTVILTPAGWRALDVQRGDVPPFRPTRRTEVDL